jgi:amidase
VLDRSACGSSSGTGAAVAASLAAAGIGSETDGSVTCPSALNGLVGLKPTAGLVSQKYIVPISHSQDTAGPMGRTVKDAALLMNAIAVVPEACQRPDVRCQRVDYTAQLRDDALGGKRIGVLRYDAASAIPMVDATYEHALQLLRDAGATLVEVKLTVDPKLGDAEERVLDVEFKADIDAYLADTPPAVKSRTLEALIAFNAKTPAEMRWFGQETFIKAQASKGLDDPEYLTALEFQRRVAGPDGLGKLLADEKLDALVTPTTGPAWTIDTLNGDHYGSSFTTLPAVSGYPHLTVPMGLVRELPVGLSFVGPPNSDALLLGLGYAFEAASHARAKPKYLPTIDRIER